jgi:hypothetical protein
MFYTVTEIHKGMFKLNPSKNILTSKVRFRKFLIWFYAKTINKHFCGDNYCKNVKVKHIVNKELDQHFNVLSKSIKMTGSVNFEK